MQKRSDRGRRHARLGKPGIKGTDSRFYPKAAEGDAVYEQQHGSLISSRHGSIQDSPEGKVDGRAIGQQEDQPQKSKCGASQGVIQILPAGKDRLSGKRMQHQGYGNQREQLIKEIHGEHIL